ncbi:hypothetical protein, partial [Desulfosarcina cetonica]|uniref:hypothetical protein n=1 Tax=Desulfosarcina cetonica TaxID=90730 RepID=UPI003BEF3C44
DVVGANLFRLFFVLGAGAVIQPLPIDPVWYMDLGMLTAASVLPFVFLFSGRMGVMGRREGGLALLLYLLYLLPARTALLARFRPPIHMTHGLSQAWPVPTSKTDRGRHHKASGTGLDREK